MSGGGKRGWAPTLALAPLVFVLATLAIFAGGASAAAVQTDPATAPGAAATPIGTRIIVQWQAGSDRAERSAARAEAGVESAGELGDPSFQLVEAEAGESAAAAARALAADPAVAVAEPDGMRRVEAVPDDPFFSQEWGLRNTGQAVAGLPAGKNGNDIDVVSAWNRSVGRPGTVVADIDSGYRFDSPDVGPVAWTNPGEIPENGKDDDHNGFVDDVHGWDFVGESISSPTQDADPTDSNLVSGGHGVHTAGTIGAAGDDGKGISGVARDARIMPLRVCTNDPSIDEVRCLTSAVVAAINYAGANGADVANLSLGGTQFSQAEVNAFAEHPGTLYVIAAGNDNANDDSGESGTKGHHYPCDYQPATQSSPTVPGAIENTICVAALDPGETLASYSDYGAQSVDLGAPGTAVLSTFPSYEKLFSDDFEGGDFATKWTPYGAGFGLADLGDGPLTSHGITDTPGAAPLASHVYAVELSNGISVPAGAGACRVEGRRFRKGGAMPYGVIVDGSEYREFNGGETSGSAMVPFRTVLIKGLGGHSVQPFFEYDAGVAPSAAEGAWLDDLSLSCNAPLSTPPGYYFLEGTSMAAPHVSGAAALLFSLDPGASVAEVRTALLGTTAPVAGLSGKTVTGGRLDVSAALNQLVPPGTETTAPETELTTETPATTESHEASFHARRVDADGGSLECAFGPGDASSVPFQTCGDEYETFVPSGIHTLRVRAVNEAGTVDPTPAEFTWTVTGSGEEEEPGEGEEEGGNEEEGGGEEKPGTLPPGEVAKVEAAIINANPPAAIPAPLISPSGCTVPKLAGKTLGQAKAALAAAGCTLRSASPKAKKGAKLVVRSSTPAAGAHAGTGQVALKLAPKPKPRHH